MVSGRIMPSARLRSRFMPAIALAFVAAAYFYWPRPRTTAVAAFGGCVSASPLLIHSTAGERIIVASSRGEIAAIDPGARSIDWQATLAADWGEEIWLLATPVVVDRKLVVAYQTRSLRSGQRTSHRVAVIDVER